MAWIFHCELALSAAPGVTREYDHSLPFDPLRSTDRPRPRLCPRASGPVRDPDHTARRRMALRAGRVPLTCLSPSPLSSDFRTLAPCGAAPGSVRHLSMPPALQRSPADARHLPFLDPLHPEDPRTLYWGEPEAPEPRLPLGLLPNPSVVSSLPVGTVPGAFAASPARGVTPDPFRRLLTRRESVVPTAALLTTGRFGQSVACMSGPRALAPGDGLWSTHLCPSYPGVSLEPSDRKSVV